MPDYTRPFSAAGSAAGMAGGGLLGQLLAPLQYPREALWNLPGKLAEGDWLGAAPGLLGAGAAGLGAALGGGLPLALLGGALAGGAAQGIGKALDPERFEAPSGADLVEALGGDRNNTMDSLLGTLAEVAGDPLTYAGGAGGAAKGGAYGAHLGELAAARGPRYAGGAEKLTSMLGSELHSPTSIATNLPERVQAMLSGPYRDQILNEIRPGATALGQGAEAIAMRNGPDSVLRIAGGPGAFDVARSTGMDHVIGSPIAPGPTPHIPEVLQPAREVAIGPYRLSHTPLVDVAPDKVLDNPFQALTIELGGAKPELDNAVRARGFDAIDTHLGNIGRVEPGRYAVTDPGAVGAPPGVSLPERTPNVQGGPVSHFLLDLLGSDSAVQREIEQGLAQSRATSGISLPSLPGKVARVQSKLPDQLGRIEADRARAVDRLVDLTAARKGGLQQMDIHQGIDRADTAAAQIREALGIPATTGPSIDELVKQRVSQRNLGG